MESGARRSGVIVLRVWIEQEAVVRLRARITQSLDEGGETTSVIVAGVDDVCSMIRAQLEAFSGGRPGTGR
jgi:hypothetical protein